LLYPKFYLNNNHLLQKKLFIFISILIFWFSLFYPQAAFSAKDNHAGLDNAEAAICFKCHKDLANPPPNGYVHVPFATGDCMVCHELTKTINSKSLIQAKSCVTCVMTQRTPKKRFMHQWNLETALCVTAPTNPPILINF